MRLPLVWMILALGSDSMIEMSQHAPEMGSRGCDVSEGGICRAGPKATAGADLNIAIGVDASQGAGLQSRPGWRFDHRHDYALILLSLYKVLSAECLTAVGVTLGVFSSHSLLETFLALRSVIASAKRAPESGSPRRPMNASMEGVISECIRPLLLTASWSSAPQTVLPSRVI